MEAGGAMFESEIGQETASKFVVCEFQGQLREKVNFECDIFRIDFINGVILLSAVNKKSLKLGCIN